MGLRPYQTETVFRIQQEFARGHGRLLVQEPTGTGKTWVGVDLVRRAEGKKLLYIVPRDEILEQTSQKLTQLRVRHILLKAGVFSDLSAADCVLAMSQTLARRIADGRMDGWAPSLIIVDEARELIEQHRAVLARWKCPVIGFDATPVRLDGKSLTDLWPHMIVGRSIRWYQRGGWLVPTRTIYATVPDLSRLHMRAGDYDQGELSDAYSTTEILQGLVASWKHWAKGRRTITFTAGITASKALVSAFLAAGVRAEHVDGSTPKHQRRAALERLRTHRIDVLCNCNLFVAGLDIVELEAIQIATDTMSLARYLQMAGRGLRPSLKTHKRDVVILLHGEKLKSHGDVSAVRDWTRGGEVVEAELVPQCARCGRETAVPSATCAACQQAERNTPARLTPVQAERAARFASAKTPERPPPAWTGVYARQKWIELEAKRVRDERPLAWVETECRRFLSRKGLT